MTAMMAPHCTSVLIVEDLEDVAETTAELLSICGYQTAIAPNAAAAIRLTESHPPDVLLLDLWLPDAHGVEVARTVRSRPGKQPVIIALTGQSSEAEKRAAREAGVDVFLVKPVDVDALLEALADTHLRPPEREQPPLIEAEDEIDRPAPE